MAPEPYSAQYHGFDTWGGSVDGSSEAGISDLVMPGACVVEIALDEDLLGALCRRSRRRLRDIQHSCEAVLKLDRVRKTLRVCGTAEAIQAVRNQLASLCGPRKQVNAAVWAELMRTRTMQDLRYAVVARLQQETGCRVHIERSRREVRLFGPAEGAEIAARRIDELAQEVCEEAVYLDMTLVSQEVLQGLAHICRVTLHLDTSRIVVLGLTENVGRAAEELQKIAVGQASFDWASACPMDVAMPLVRGLSRKPSGSCLSADGISYASGEDTTADSLPVQSMGLVTTKIPQEEAFAVGGQAQAAVARPQGAQAHGGAGPGFGGVAPRQPQHQQHLQKQHQQHQQHLPRRQQQQQLQMQQGPPQQSHRQQPADACMDVVAGPPNANYSVAYPDGGSACPSCGTGAMCLSCGAPTWQPNFAVLPDGGMYAVAMPMPKSSVGKVPDSPNGQGAPDQNQAATWGMQWVPYDGGMGVGGGQQMVGRMVPVCFAQGQMPQGMMQMCIAGGQAPTHI